MTWYEKVEGEKKITSRKFCTSKQASERTQEKLCLKRRREWGDRVPLLIILIRVFQHETFSLFGEMTGSRGRIRNECGCWAWDWTDKPAMLSLFDIFINFFTAFLSFSYHHRKISHIFMKRKNGLSLKLLWHGRSWGGFCYTKWWLR